jgi:hypothetical protein
MKWLFALAFPIVIMGCGAAATRSSDVVVQIEGATSATPTELTEIVLHEPDETMYVGDIRIDGDEMSSTSKIVLHANGVARSLNLETYSRTLKHTEILEKRGDRVVRWKVKYGTAASLVLINGDGDPDKIMPTLKKSYIVELRGNAVRVTDKHGREVSKEEREAVIRLEIVTKKKKRKPLAQRPRPDQTDAATPPSLQHKARIGDELPWLARYLEEELNIESADATLETEVHNARLAAIYDVDGDTCAVVSVVMHLVRNEADRTHTDTKLEGQVVMRANDGALIGLTVSGPQRTKGTLKTKEGELQYGGRGTVKLRMRRRWEARGQSPQ